MRRSARALLLPLIAISVAIVPVTGHASLLTRSTTHVGDERGEPPPVPRRLRLNEVDYDQPGIDDEEFVEVFNGGSRRVRLRRVVLILVNGTISSEYRRIRLAGRLGPSRTLVLASDSVQVEAGARTLPLPLARDNVQNGSPDAVVLFDTANRAVVDALSYEGSITDATFEGVPRTWSLVQGSPVAESDSNETAVSLCRLPHGADTHDDDHDWTACAPSPGGDNERG